MKEFRPKCNVIIPHVSSLKHQSTLADQLNGKDEMEENRNKADERFRFKVSNNYHANEGNCKFSMAMYDS